MGRRRRRKLDAAANGVCSYVAAAYNRGQQINCGAIPDPVDIAGDGTLRHVYIIEQGTAHVSLVIASTTTVITRGARDGFR